ncbi:MAG: TIGR02281 family clan AA aspartic protease [Gammaproteobacteria bacterium]|nr:MAG: TIGR02281 family clan AA aspartic protease [Gammaproteobacteria bacterium]
MSDDDNSNPQQGMGGTMIIAMWLLLFAMLGYLFSDLLEQKHNPNQQLQTIHHSDGVREISLQRNHYGHYVASGSINDHPVTFMLDTGASDVAIPEATANRIGLRKGRALTYQTANGKITVYATLLDDIALGDIRLQQVRATINPNVQGDDILLGMSFLKHIEFTQRGNTLTLRQYPDN